MEHGTMTSRGSNHNTIINWYEIGIELQEGIANQNGSSEREESMYYPDSSTQKEVRRKRIDRNRKDRFDDYVKEKRVRRPRTKNIKHYDYNEWNE